MNTPVRCDSDFHPNWAHMDSESSQQPTVKRSAPQPGSGWPDNSPPASGKPTVQRGAAEFDSNATVIRPDAHQESTPTVIQSQQPTVKRLHVPAEPPTSPTLMLNQERLLSQAPRTQHEGKEAPMLGGVPLLAKIGQGGMGAVYYGVHPQTKEGVAVKVLPLQLGDQTQAIDRFLREARLATVVQSPHLVAVHDVGHDSGLYYFQMEYVRGKSAGQYMRELLESGAGCVDEGTALDICIAAAEGLAAAHTAGIIHRDIKPDNILIPADPVTGELLYDQAKVADLGLARSLEDDQTMTATQTALGTPGFMAPEQCRDAKRAEMTADIFSLGATLYALLAGRPPFQARTSVDTILATLTRQHMPMKQMRPEISEITSELIERCLSKEPRIRYENASRLLDALLVCRDLRRSMSTLGLGLRAPLSEKGAAHDPSLHPAPPRAGATPRVAATPPRTPRAQPFPVRKKGPNLVALVAGTALLAIGVTWTLTRRESTRPSTESTAQLPNDLSPMRPTQSGAPETGAPQAGVINASAPIPDAQRSEGSLPAAMARPASTEPAQIKTAPDGAQVSSHPAQPANGHSEVRIPFAPDAREPQAVPPQQRDPAPPIRPEPPAQPAQPTEEDLREREAAKLRQDALEKAHARAVAAVEAENAAHDELQKVQGDYNAAKDQVEHMQLEARQMEMQFAQRPRGPQGGPPPRRGGGGRDGGREGQPPPPEDQQMIERANMLRVELERAKQRLRDLTRDLAQATYEQQKAKGTADLAIKGYERLKDKLD
jgi:serine/threonine protein kinase